ncbi:MAG: hypothetical protein KME56_12115 [Candidatus Thiodiazotropha sp. (ex Ctena orbiculata)]|nr:hypothetical protein [Candidatus Thiodiazotropha taylori]MBT2997367.1 hypothetical protein [Candidatus Thiodiazotropha taylori]MBT3000923.1 hypothetical protein [Candidatus Thiodiazotropha taylori]MBV2108155.1 hypothetical protein [Candidatus Thiodiazotropha taylori]MBV2111776.1 hypothetical protein [Candidatus Thiodiazotropha taylori]
MKSIKTIAVAAFVLISFSAHAGDSGSAFKALFSAIAQVAAQQRADLGGSRYGGHEDAYHEGGYQQAGYYEEGPVIYNISGSWGMRSGKVNRFQKSYDGYYVIPVGRGKGVHYVEIGENLYQDANSSGTYEVIDRDYMVWRSNDKRNLVIELFRQ